MLSLAIQGRAQFALMPARSTLVRWVGATLSRDAELTLRFVDAREGRRLNRDFRGKDYATDVLTFSYSTEPIVHADIVICVPVVRRAAREQRKSMHDHLAHLIVHGVLHAQGHRHHKAAAAQAMETRETEILMALGKPAPYQL